MKANGNTIADRADEYERLEGIYGKETTKNHQKSPFLKGCVISGLVNL